jgi:hypothetical protein
MARNAIGAGTFARNFGTGRSVVGTDVEEGKTACAGLAEGCRVNVAIEGFDERAGSKSRFFSSVDVPASASKAAKLTFGEISGCDT